MGEQDNDESRTQVVPTVAGSEMLTLQSLLQRAAPMLKNPEAFAVSERMALAGIISETLQTAEEDCEPGSWLAPWE